MIVDKDLQNLVITNSLFNGLPKDYTRNYIKPKNFLKINEGDIIFKNGDAAGEIYLIAQGEIKIKNSETQQKQNKYLSDFFGEYEFEINKERVSTAIANRESILYKISFEELNTLISTYKIIKLNLTHENPDTNFNLPFTETVNIISEEILNIPAQEVSDVDLVLDDSDEHPELTDEELENILMQSKNKSS